jgi:hypothetical protein
MQKEKIIRRGKKCLSLRSKGGWQEQNKISNPQVMGGSDIKNLSNVNSH